MKTDHGRFILFILLTLTVVLVGVLAFKEDLEFTDSCKKRGGVVLRVRSPLLYIVPKALL